MIRLISHCHTHHSFDSLLRVNAIVEEAIKNNVNVIIINDHDVFLLNEVELELLHSNNILVLNAIEFTSQEGVHIIGVHQNIKSLQLVPFAYTVVDLLNLLNELGAKIIFPHPFHATGIYGNNKISDEEFDNAISYADAFEVDNYRYGETPSFLVNNIIKIKPRVCGFIGSDAHKKNEVGAFINSYDVPFKLDERYVMSVIFEHQPDQLRLKQRSRLYFKFKTFQKSDFYQLSINLISPSVRKKIKSLFKFGSSK